MPWNLMAIICNVACCIINAVLAAKETNKGGRMVNFGMSVVWGLAAAFNIAAMVCN